MSVSRPASATPDAQRRAEAITLMVFDIDGVFTDGRIYYGAEGDTLKAFNTLDGFGIKQIMRAGVDVAIITGRRSEIVAKRAAELGISRVVQGAGNKAQALDALLSTCQTDIARLGYMGDDWPDLNPLCRAHFACAPANAHPDVRARVHYVTAARGGEGAVRETCDLILRAHGGYEQLLADACRI